jgi:hypothetical protein
LQKMQIARGPWSAKPMKRPCPGWTGPHPAAFKSAMQQSLRQIVDR